MEVGTLDMPAFTVALLEWADGRPIMECAPFVDFSQRQCPNALRLAGWSHTFGGIMKSVAYCLANWDEVLAQLRTLVVFLGTKLGASIV